MKLWQFWKLLRKPVQDAKLLVLKFKKINIGLRNRKKIWIKTEEIFFCKIPFVIITIMFNISCFFYVSECSKYSLLDTAKKKYSLTKWKQSLCGSIMHFYFDLRKMSKMDTFNNLDIAIWTEVFRFKTWRLAAWDAKTKANL